MDDVSASCFLSLLTMKFLVELRHLNTIDGVLLRINKGLEGVISVWILIYI